MNTIYTTHAYVRPVSSNPRRSLFWNKVADIVLCGACTMGLVVAMFFLLTM